MSSRKKSSFDEPDLPKQFWGSSGAGVIVFAKDTCRVLAMKRSMHVNEPNTYGTIGGRLDFRETPTEGATRELQEETGYKGEVELIPAHVFSSPRDDFTFHNFVGIVDHEFVPELNWETQKAEWVELEELAQKKELHFGLKELLNKSSGIIREWKAKCERGEI